MFKCYRVDPTSTELTERLPGDARGEIKEESSCEQKPWKYSLAEGEIIDCSTMDKGKTFGGKGRVTDKFYCLLL